jgi:hypothetical protein
LGSRAIAPRILDLGTRWRSVVSFTILSLHALWVPELSGTPFRAVLTRMHHRTRLSRFSLVLPILSVLILSSHLHLDFPRAQFCTSYARFFIFFVPYVLPIVTSIGHKDRSYVIFSIPHTNLRHILLPYNKTMRTLHDWP